MVKLLKFKNFFRSSNEPVHLFKYNHFINSLSKDKLNEILLFSEGDHLFKFLPEFTSKKVLYLNDQRHKFIFKKILAREPMYMVNYIYGGKSLQVQNPGYCTIIGDLENPALKDQHFDLVVCPFALDTDQFSPKILKSLCQVLKNGGRLILSLRHPQLEHMIFNQNPSVTGAPGNLLSKYFSLLKENSLYTEDIQEGQVNLPLKPYFSLDGVYDHYHEYKGTPLTLFLRAVKFIKKS